MALLPTDPKARNYVFGGLLAVMAAGAYYQLLYTPHREALAAVEEHVDALAAANHKAEAELAKGNVNELRAEAARFRENLELMRQLVPTSNEVPALLEQVSTAARRVGLDIGAVEPEPVIEGDQFDTYRYRITVLGDYHAVGEFLTNVGSLTRIIAPVNLRLQPAEQVIGRARPRPGQSQLNSQIEIQTYVARTAPPVRQEHKS
jgi:type IV pilus assembly protein PilO